MEGERRAKEEREAAAAREHATAKLGAGVCMFVCFFVCVFGAGRCQRGA